MQLKNSNVWLIASLLVTTIFGPVIVWNLQQGKIENLKLKLEEEKVQLDKNKQLVEMFEKLSKLLAEHRQLYDAYATLVQAGHTIGGFQLQRIKQAMDEKDQEIANVKQIISGLSGKNILIKGNLVPLPPSGIRLR